MLPNTGSIIYYSGWQISPLFMAIIVLINTTKTKIDVMINDTMPKNLNVKY